MELVRTCCPPTSGLALPRSRSRGRALVLAPTIDVALSVGWDVAALGVARRALARVARAPWLAAARGRGPSRPRAGPAVARRPLAF